MGIRLDRLQKQKTKSQYQEELILLFSACLNQDESYDDTDQQLDDIKKSWCVDLLFKMDERATQRLYLELYA